MSVELAIRAYDADDRARIRHICCETGYMGEPIDFLWSHRESFADLITRYYTDREPESLLVATLDGEVAGYLSGCVDSRRARGAAARESLRLIRRGALLRPGMAPFLWRAAFDLLRDAGPAPEEVLLDPRWPAHLHIDLLPEARGRRLGRRLMETWFARLRSLGSAGVHLGTFAENGAAIAFFTACGFARHGEPRRAPGFRTREGARMHVQWMTRSLEEGA